MIYLFIAIILIGFTGGAYEHIKTRTGTLPLPPRLRSRALRNTITVTLTLAMYATWIAWSILLHDGEWVFTITSTLIVLASIIITIATTYWNWYKARHAPA